MADKLFPEGLRRRINGFIRIEGQSGAGSIVRVMVGDSSFRLKRSDALILKRTLRMNFYGFCAREQAIMTDARVEVKEKKPKGQLVLKHVEVIKGGPQPLNKSLRSLAKDIKKRQEGRHTEHQERVKRLVEDREKQFEKEKAAQEKRRKETDQKRRTDRSRRHIGARRKRRLTDHHWID